MTAETKPIHPPLTAEEFDTGCGYTYEGVSICEDENGSWVYAYGHVDPETFARVVNTYDREEGGMDEDWYDAGAVQHLWAVTEEPADAPDGWWIRWDGVTATTPQAFAITVVSR